MTNTETLAICEHLQSIVYRLLALEGTKVDYVDTGWSAVKFVLVLNKGPSLNELKETLLGNYTHDFLEVGQNDDPHYPLQVEIVCKVCKHGVAWPALSLQSKSS